jgi:polar amino acid transport system permease protein
MTIKRPKTATWRQNARTWPWWLIIAIILSVYLVIMIIANPETNKTFWYLIGQSEQQREGATLVFKGVVITLTVAVCGYLFAMIFGLILGLMRTMSNPWLQNIATFYVEVVRGVPMLVLLLYVAFALTGLFVNAVRSIGIDMGSVPNEVRGIVALGLAYAAFEAEIFRAGIQSIERGQYEAARALGMNFFQTMRHIILPQAIRRVLPALGNDFVSMVKDSSLVSVLGVQDMTQLGKLWASGNFRYMETLTILAFIYLMIVVVLTRLLRMMERRLQRVYIR